MADKTAKEVAEQGILALVPVKQIKILNLKPKYSKLDEQLAEQLKASQNTEGWWVTARKAGNSNPASHVRTCERKRCSDT